MLNYKNKLTLAREKIKPAYNGSFARFGAFDLV
jgi:hypothetical protein